MQKHKITGIIMGALMLSGVVLGGSAIHNVKITNDNTKVVNKVLLAAPSSTVGERAVVVNTDNSPLVLYSNASANSTITSYISVGEMLTIQNAGNNFYKVKVQETGAVGYISAHNLQIITSGVNEAYNAVNKQGYIINVSSVVNLRANATMNSNILAKLNNNTKLNVLGKQGQWYKVNCDGTIGYIYQEYIGLTNANLENSNNSESTNTSSHTTVNKKDLDTSQVTSNTNSNKVNSINKEKKSLQNKTKSTNRTEKIFIPKKSVLEMVNKPTGLKVVHVIPSGISEVTIIKEDPNSVFTYIEVDGIYGYVHTKALKACEYDYTHINSFKGTNLI
ncbi:SH3 domain-containing protein [Clostridium mediterraneense]|uniref:SH3 domain-containing protein n=1 Tax=Clostridium mediterraneense TaxID=1805472 RepID=UPI0008374615|nr:SH3 domain-containing protein [Clostridium mediterraneense]